MIIELRKIIVSLMLMVSIGSYAEIDCLIVYEKTGIQSIIPIKEASEIKFGVQTISVGSYEFIIDNIKRYEFGDSRSLGIEDVTGDISKYKIDPKGLITFSAPIQQEIRVYNSQGLSFDIKPEDNIIDISHLPTGIYIVKIGYSSIKLIKK